MNDRTQLLEEISEAVKIFEEEQSAELCKKAVNMGIAPLDIIMEGLSRGMERAGVLFKAQEYFVPEILLCADAMGAGLAVVQPLLQKEEGLEGKATIVLGTVEGDVHDIGKNLVRLMLEVGGYKVIDLGVDVPGQKFVDAMLEHSAPIVALSAMMTTTMMAMEKTIPMLRQARPDVKIMIGGAPISSEIVTLFKADAYAKNATDAPKTAAQLL